MNIPPPVMPKEHGLWVWVLLPFLVGAGTATGDRWGVFIAAFLAVLFWFLAVTPARMVYKNRKRGAPQNRSALIWSACYGLAGTVAGLGAFMLDMRIAVFFILLAPAFYFGVRAAHTGRMRSALFEFGGIFYLSGLVFMGAWSFSGGIEKFNAAVWAFVLLFMLDRSVQTRLLVRSFGRSSRGPVPTDSAGLVCRINLFISMITIIGVSVLLELFYLNRLPLAIFAPGIVLTLYRYVRTPQTLRAVGFSELFLAILFGVLMTALSGFFRQ